MQQFDLIEPLAASRRAVAKERAATAIARVADKAEATSPGWCDRACQALRELAKRTHPGMFTIEKARMVLEDLQNFERPHDGRAWGAVTQQAVRLGYITKVKGKYAPAISSNNSEKPLFTKGPKA